MAHKVIPRKHHKYLTLVSDHGTSTIVWGAPGKDAATLGTFFDALPEGGLEQLEAVSMDLGLAYIKAVRERAPGAVICFDPFYSDVRIMPMWSRKCFRGNAFTLVRSA